MFDIKCVYCKHFNPKDGCNLNIEEEFCSAYEEQEITPNGKDKPSCKNCAWQTNGYCDFDFESPLSCRHYKSLKEDL